ncbi:MAG: signal peptide peptidase SppA [Gammaproteobacteria bacterium]|nr:signal peptide peptidase SppA [Gammaproteobacteria bacterium]
MAASNPIRRLFSGIWSGLNALRRVLHLILLLFIFGILLAGLSGPQLYKPHDAALLVDPVGELVEQLSGDALDRALGELQGDGIRQVLLRDLLDSLQAAVDDERITTVVLRLERFEGGSLPSLRAVATTLDGLRAAGKRVIAVGDSFEQHQYYLAAHADEIYLNKLGMVFIDGFGYYRTFFKSALEKLQVDLNVFRVGEYKSFVEPFIRDDMSAEDRQASRQWLQSMWSAFQRDVVAARGLQPGALDDYANGFSALLEADGGSASAVALGQKLVDGLMGRQQFDEYMIGLVGEAGEQSAAAYNSIDYRQYLRLLRRVPAGLGQAGEQVGIIVAAGQIVDGEASPGEIGGDTLAELARQASEDDSIKAVVLRVDSPGGSMFASEVALDGLRALKASGKPLVVSMGGVAASGGYYISMAADEIWADETTITGSIGVGALVPTVDRGLDALGVHVDGFGTTRLSGQLRLDRPLGEEARQVLQQTVQDAYRIFVGSVAEAREMPFKQTDEIARGRVWIGADARDLGLVDSLGGLDAAVASAASLAGLAEGDYTLRYIEPELGWPARLLEQYAVRVLGTLQRLGLRVASRDDSAMSLLRARFERQLQALSRMNDPLGIYMLCSCTID